ncbi:MAG: serine protease [Gammaproteobacteria bacterium]|nr:serine protease [Gammaproteobacteria bacterium]NND55338.1 serine protease [Gammaproteobacteria bacterium]
MRTAITTILLLLLTSGTSPAHAIVNGSEVSDARFAERYPWAVTVVNAANGGICGGVLVAPRWVLTAAHCSWGRRYVLAGNVDRSKARRVEVERTIRHPKFSLDALQNDAALLYLAEAQPMQPASLASPAQVRELLKPGVTAKIVGWGKTERSKQPVDRLHEAVIRLTELTTVGTRYAYVYRSGPCSRDSGNAMLLQTIAGDWLVVGIANATGGNLCATDGGLAVYTSIAPLSSFIRSYLDRD